jgi:hypothetical protein
MHCKVMAKDPVQIRCALSYYRLHVEFAKLIRTPLADGECAVNVVKFIESNTTKVVTAFELVVKLSHTKSDCDAKINSKLSTNS